MCVLLTSGRLVVVSFVLSPGVAELQFVARWARNACAVRVTVSRPDFCVSQLLSALAKPAIALVTRSQPVPRPPQTPRTPAM